MYFVFVHLSQMGQQVQPPPPGMPDRIVVWHKGGLMQAYNMLAQGGYLGKAPNEWTGYPLDKKLNKDSLILCVSRTAPPMTVPGPVENNMPGQSLQGTGQDRPQGKPNGIGFEPLADQAMPRDGDNMFGAGDDLAGTSGDVYASPLGGFQDVPRG